MGRRRTILIVEDSVAHAVAFQSYLEHLGHEILLAADGKSACAIMRDRQIDCVLLELKLPDVDGLDILIEIRKSGSSPAVVITTSNASLAMAVKAVRAGAFDYLVKPFHGARLVTAVENALANVVLRADISLSQRSVVSGGFADFIGQSLPMQMIYRTIEAAAPSMASVFIYGESGTGKELAAEALHRFSRRSHQAFVSLNCAAIPRDLMESMIFGHMKGSFTGATTDQEGIAARADGGTMFLDELGAMAPSLQTKLLRFIQTGVYERVGEGRPRKADIRFVSATNREPITAIRTGQLQEDLYYRLNVVPLELPPLRIRGDDILLIARTFLRGFADTEEKFFTSFSPEVERCFLAYPWPGNVRQLQNVVRNVVVLHNSHMVTLAMLPPMNETPVFVTIEIESNVLEVGSAAGESLDMPVLPGFIDGIETLAIAEQRYIENAIALCRGNLQLAARRLEISPSTIYRKRETWLKNA